MGDIPKWVKSKEDYERWKKGEKPIVVSSNKIWLPQVIVSAMLIWALNPDNPYGYYIILRWATCALFIFLAYRALQLNKNKFVFWLFGVTAFIYNPIIRIHLNREIWSIINLITIIIAVMSIFVLKPANKKV